MSVQKDQEPVHEPFNVEVEVALLGTLMRDPGLVPIAGGLVEEAEFYDPLFGEVFKTMLAWSNEDTREISHITLAQQFKSHPAAKEIDVAQQFRFWVMSAPAMPDNADSKTKWLRNFCGTIRELALRREALQNLGDAVHTIRHSPLSVSLAMRGVMQTADRAVQIASKGKRVSLYDDAVAMLHEAEERLAGKPVEAVTTGLDKLNVKLGGLQAGDYAIVAGRPGMGKSAALSTVARACAQGFIKNIIEPQLARPTFVASHEMTVRQWNRRLICDAEYEIRPAGEEPLEYNRFRSGRLTAHEIERAARVLPIIDALPIEFCGPGEFSNVHELLSRARSFIGQQKKMGVIVIDYLQIIPASDRYKGSKVQEITEISNTLMRFAKSQGWPLVVGCQLSRETEKRDNKMPVLSDLRESGAIEQDADIVIGLYRAGYYLETHRPPAGPNSPEWDDWKIEYDACRNKLDVLLLKNREGPTTAIEVFCEMEASVIRDHQYRGAVYQEDIAGLLGPA